MTSTSSRERSILHALVALHALAITLPYAWAALIVPEGFVWGGLLFSPDDQNVHLAWARQAADGHFFVRDLFTTENLVDNSRPLFFNSLTFLVGILSRLTTLEPVFLLHAVRVASAILGLYALHSLTRRWSDDWRVRVSGVAIAAFAGGAGWLRDIFPQVLGSRALIDRPDSPVPMMPEAWGFASNFIYALNAASFLLLCLALKYLLQAREDMRSRKALVIASFCAALLANIHTYDALPLIVVIVLASLIEMRRGEARPSAWKASLTVVAAALIPIAWQVWVYLNSEEFRLKANTKTAAPPFVDILLSYSPLLLLAIAGLLAMKRGRAQVLEAGRVWPLVWAGAVLLLIYAPVSFARKMIEGLHLPLAFLAALGLVALLESVPRNLKKPLWAGAVALLSISMVQFVAWCVGTGWRDNSSSRGLMPPLYIPQGDADALKYLRAQPDASRYLRAVLCSPYIGSYVPRATGMSTYAGHWAETLNLQTEKLPRVVAFYQGQMTPNEARQFLRSNRIGWVLEGPYERGQDESRLSATYPFLRQAWAGGQSRVFQVED